MKKIKVNPKNYAFFEYPEYSERGTAVSRPDNPTFEVGHVVYDKEHNTIGVVDGELRLDTDGMVCIDKLEFATVDSFCIHNVCFASFLKDEVCELLKT